ncbi:hypothetical protein CPC08DRAFT_710452 [Agrocybe pediades]|nr:hypothetical protein CPC08DRAFT_710452 [Agrocybe pediades]
MSQGESTSLNTDTDTWSRVEDLWFEDADVVFRAGSKLFRLSRCLLSRRSPVFNDILSIPANATPIYEGCTLVHLPDGEEDATLFFRAIFDSSFFEAGPKPPPIETIIAIARMSNKYQVGYLERRAFVHLNKLFYLEGDLHRRNLTALRQTGLIPSNSSKEETNRVYKAYLDIIELAHSHDKKWVMPRAATFFCMLASMDAVVKSDAWNASTVSVREYTFLIRDKFRDARVRFLSCIPKLSGTVRPASALCCKARAVTMLSRVVTDPVLLTKYLPGERIWKDAACMLCPSCSKCLKSHISDAEVAFWKDLPASLGIGTWRTLKEEKDSFMAGDT